MSRILVVDDEGGMRELLRILLEKEGHEVVTAADGLTGLELAVQQAPALVISDIRMPRLTGVEFLAGLRERGLEVPVILLTAYASRDAAIQAMKLGAFDYITKPFKVQEIKVVIQRAFAEAERRQRAEIAQPEPAVELSFHGIIGRSPKMLELYTLIGRVAAVDSSVLISGESGTGKELVARTTHYNSLRAPHPFVAINCGAIPEELLESELFGHVKGAFTGAIVNKAGLVEIARGGTVFLDEVAEMSPSLQVKLLRFLQDHIFRRVGGTEDFEADVRIMAATNKDLAALTREGGFREDLYYRLNVIPVEIPPLRERWEDIPLLARNFLELYAGKAGRGPMGIAPEAMEVLMAHAWPGNVRELENVMERAVALATGDEARIDHLPPSITQPAAQPQAGSARLAFLAEGFDLERAVAEFEQSLMRDALEKAGWVQARAAELLGITFQTFRYRLKKYGLDRVIRDRGHGDA